MIAYNLGCCAYNPFLKMVLERSEDLDIDIDIRIDSGTSGDRMEKGLLATALIGLLAGNGLVAQGMPNQMGFGVHAGLAFPAGDDLRMTAKTGVNLGVNASWTLGTSSDLRARLDLLSLAEGHQDVVTPLVQHLDTKVQGLSVGCEYLYRLENSGGRWAVGPGIYFIRWSVESTNRVTVTGAGVAQNSGTSHWNRVGLGLLGTYRITRQLEAETRWISSHYGYENLPARFGTLGLLWRF